MRRLRLVLTILCLQAAGAKTAGDITQTEGASPFQRPDDQRDAVISVLERSPKGETPGCKRPSGGLKSGNLTISMQDPGLGPTQRRVRITVPEGEQAAALPLLVLLHGQTGTPETASNAWLWSKLAASGPFVLAGPAGMMEGGTFNDTTWNVNTAGDDSTCTPNTTAPDIWGNNNKTSCARLNRTGRCNWASCYDDVFFIALAIRTLGERLCLDSRRFFIAGESNGGMMVYEVLSQLRGVFLAALVTYGLPLNGYQAGSRNGIIDNLALARRTSLLAFHDRQDVIIPPGGVIHETPWAYVSGERQWGFWASMHRCASRRTVKEASIAGGICNVTCYEYAGCLEPKGSRVEVCLYNGWHGVWPSPTPYRDPQMDVNFTWDFFLSIPPPEEGGSSSDRLTYV